MELRCKNIGNGSVMLELWEELDLYSSPDFRKRMLEIFNHFNPKGLILSLRETQYIDSSGVGVLLSLLRLCQKSGCQLYLCECHNQAKEVIQMTQLQRIFKIVPTEYQALKLMTQSLKKKEMSLGGGPIKIDENHENFNKSEMKYKNVNIDFKRIRYISHIVIQNAPESIKEHNLLEQQVSEIIKNAVRHGNRNDITKEVKIWWKFTDKEARLIVEDQGNGFSNIEEWNQFFRRRMQCFLKGDPSEMTEYLSFRTEDSTPDDGGNALFAAVEYWNGDYVLNEKKNAVALRRVFSN